MKKNPDTDDPAMTRVRKLWEQKQSEGMTQEELGIAMGYDQKSARKSANQFFKSRDPRISMLRKFAKAMNVPLSQIIGE